jgi:hypothetical protein
MTDSVLILDVARFKYPPHWVSLSLAWQALRTQDKDTGKPRGWVVLSKTPKLPLLVCAPAFRGCKCMAKFAFDKLTQVAKTVCSGTSETASSETQRCGFIYTSSLLKCTFTMFNSLNIFLFLLDQFA